jgi:hypothetical protein
MSKGGHAAGEGKRVDRELRDRSIRARIRLVVEHMHAAVPHLQKIDMAGDGAGARACAGC